MFIRALSDINYASNYTQLIMKNALVLVSTCFLLLFSLTSKSLIESAEVDADFYVATNGNDAWSGTLDGPNKDNTDGPFATLERARNEVRKFKQREKKKDITVLIRGGRYYLKETVVFGLEDAATKGHTITYAAYPGEEPIFSSGIKIEGWEQYKERGWKLYQESTSELPELAKARVWVADVPDGLESFRTLYDHDRRLPRSSLCRRRST